MSQKKAIVVGISGCSSSGKTTLARMLRDIFPNTFILHEDDFYKPEDQLPIKHDLVDWDCVEAISVPDMEKALRHIHETGTFPVSASPDSFPAPSSSHRSSHGCIPPSTLPSSAQPPGSLTNPGCCQSFIASKEDQNTIGACPVSPSSISEQQSRVAAWLSSSPAGQAVLNSGVIICLLDGFLLYTPSMASVMREIDVKLFLLVSREKATARREARDGYVTLEGFWKDPPGYVEKIVWPNYVESHGWLFEGGDVEGRVKEEVVKENGIRVQEGGRIDADMAGTLEWAVGVVMAELERLVLGEGKA